ncbi:MAG: chorismate-binding protein, partial [Thermoanaerobaculia bacterium]|nr:chorismate-binding protein [Thermoanaerobaculia bacterium]
ADLSPWRFLLESVAGGAQLARYSFLGADPRLLVAVREDGLEIERDGVVERSVGDPVAALRDLVGGFAAERGPVPFTGGFVGSFGFDFVRLLERLPARPPDPWGLPAARLGRFDAVVAFDHAQQKLLLLANEIEGETGSADAEAALDRLSAALCSERAVAATPLPAEPPRPAAPDAVSLDGAAFRAAVVAAKEQIAAGEIFQVVLARRFSKRTAASPMALYRALRRINPSPYMVLLELPGAALVGASPEALVTVHGRRVTTRPIAGTRRRGRDADEEARLEAELRADPKERAEHVMLVDLGRNDLGRVATPGSVAVESFAEIERYSHVLHLVSSVTGELAPGRTAFDALCAAFPAGTVSGAPKLRAIEILDGLEPEARGDYAGAAGYLSFSGDLDACITIRTLVARDTAAGREVSVTAGAGVVADSQPESEELETEHKAAALLAAVALAEALEARA